MCREETAHSRARQQALGGVSSIKQFCLDIRVKVLNSFQDLPLNEREFLTAGALTLQALADNANVKSSQKRRVPYSK